MVTKFDVSRAYLTYLASFKVKRKRLQMRVSSGCADLDISSLVIHLLHTLPRKKMKINNQIDTGTPFRRELDKQNITDKTLYVFSHR